MHIRKYEYLNDVLVDRKSAMERNIFGFGGYLQKLWAEEYDLAANKYLRSFFRHFFSVRLYGVLSAVISFSMSLILLGHLLRGELTIGFFISVVSQLFSIMTIMVQQVSAFVKQIAKKKEYMSDVLAFLDIPEESEEVLEPPCRCFENFVSLDFLHVSFRYPGSEKYALKDVTFHLDHGRHYAFVGENAAGKTTVTKLMTGLYTDYEGSILINGKELRMYAKRELKELYSVVYQDFAKYHISVYDTITLGKTADMPEEKVTEKYRELLKKLGLYHLVEEMPEKDSTVLGKFEKGNQDISIGQWQRFAIARALMKDAPVCILDEPSASLDPASESRLYEEYGRMSEERTTVFISHRLGSVKLADEILLFDDGRLLETGSFTELIRQNGRFRMMYETQRNWYE